MLWSDFFTKYRSALILAVILAVGGWLRWDATTRFKPMGTDEYLYGAYVEYLSKEGLGAYPDLVEQYILTQQRTSDALLPPTRVFYIATSTILRQLTDWDVKRSLNVVSAICSFLMLPIGYAFVKRVVGVVPALFTTCLMATAPTQLHMAAHGLIDITISLWALLALWAMWEVMSDPDNPRKLAALAAVLAGLVLTKENAFFVVFGLGVVAVCNRWFKFGAITPKMIGAAVIGLLFGFVLLVFASGGVDNLVNSYRLFVTAAYQLPYAVANGDGPWHRYLYELTLVSPWIVILTIVAVASFPRTEKGLWFVAIFVGATYAVMSNLRYGMNLRFTNLWDLPIRFIASMYLLHVIRGVAWRPQLLMTLCAVLLAGYELQQYWEIFAARGIYEPVSIELLRAAAIVKLP